jgi:hypothetical protein
MFRSSERPQWEQAIMAEGFADPLAEVHKLAAKYTVGEAAASSCVAGRCVLHACCASVNSLLAMQTGKERHWPLDLPEAAAIPFVKLTVAARHLSVRPCPLQSFPC